MENIQMWISGREQLHPLEGRYVHSGRGCDVKGDNDFKVRPVTQWVEFVPPTHLHFNIVYIEAIQMQRDSILIVYLTQIMYVYYEQ